MTPNPARFEVARRSARRAYELARLRAAALRSLALVALVAATALLSFGRPGVLWLPCTALAWTLLEWRGGALLRGGRVGAAVGLVALATPLWAFRTCCRAGDAMMGSSCCTMARACTGVGVLLGLTLAVFAWRMPRAQRLEGIVGMGGALLAVASVRCAELVAGEALGLLGGLATGAIASGMLAVLVDRWRRTA